MTLVARVAVLVMAAVAIVNIAAGLLPRGRPQPAQPPPTPAAQPQPVPQTPAPQPVPPEARRVEDPALALSTTFASYQSVRAVRVLDARVKRAGEDIILRATATMESGHGGELYLYVDSRTTALITREGVWYTVRSTDGVGLFRGDELMRDSPPWTAGAPRSIALRFPAPPATTREVLLQVGWRWIAGFGPPSSVATRSVWISLP